MRNPEDAYKSRPDIALPLFQKDCAVADEQARPKSLIDNALASHELGSRRIGAGNGSPSPRDIAHARRTDPDTSKAAAASVVNIYKVREMILDIFERLGPMHDEELLRVYFRCNKIDRTKAPDAAPSGIRTRRKELVRDNKLVDSGERAKTASGRDSIVWRIVK